MAIQLPQLSLPLAASVPVGAEDPESVQGLLEAPIAKNFKLICLAVGTELLLHFDLLDALFAEALAAAGDLERLAEDELADGAMALQDFGGSFHKLALKPRHLFYEGCIANLKTRSCLVKHKYYKNVDIGWVWHRISLGLFTSLVLAIKPTQESDGVFGTAGGVKR